MYLYRYCVPVRTRRVKSPVFPLPFGISVAKSYLQTIIIIIIIIIIIVWIIIIINIMLPNVFLWIAHTIHTRSLAVQSTCSFSFNRKKLHNYLFIIFQQFISTALVRHGWAQI